MRTLIVLATLVALGLGCYSYNIGAFFYYAKTHKNGAPTDLCAGSACYYDSDCNYGTCLDPPLKSNLDSWYSYYLNYGNIPSAAYMGTCNSAPPRPPPSPPSPEPSGNSSTLLYVGIGVGVLVIIGIAVGVILYLKKKPAANNMSPQLL